MQSPFPVAFVADLKRQFNNDFEVGMTIVIPLDGRCPEQVGDDLRLWLRSNRYRGWRQVKRGKTDSVRFEFESPTDAVLFRLADDQSPTPLYCLPDDEERAVTTAQLLLDRGADRKVRNAQGQTPAAAARARGLDDAADVLQGKHDAG